MGFMGVDAARSQQSDGLVIAAGLTCWRHAIWPDRVESNHVAQYTIVCWVVMNGHAADRLLPQIFD